ncbi:MAG: integrase core domain-containing protein [Gammaproteobacteria bacterium]|nr:integrase core domain-containing protein [Gammaproteobacteria bacterium]
MEKYFHYYNTQRPHTALDRRTPDAVYFGENELPQAA